MKKKTSKKVKPTLGKKKTSASVKKKSVSRAKPAPKIEKIGITSAASIEKHTGKNWDEWIELLDRAGARSWTYKEITAFAKTKYKGNAWWQQIVANGYEVFTGKRLEGQNSKGDYQATITKTLQVNHKTIWKFLSSEEGMSVWLKPLSPILLKPKEQFEAEGGFFGEIRTMKAGVRVRLTWQDIDWEKKTVVNLGLNARKNGSTIIYINHEGFKNTRTREQMRGHWTNVLSEIKSHLT